MFDLPKELEELKAFKHWVCYRLEPRPTKEDPDHLGKVPYNPVTGYKAKANDPGTWSDYETAVKTAERGGYDGIGFELGNSGYCGIDIDHCVTDGQASDTAAKIAGYMESYTEYSISGTGLHIITKSAPLEKTGYNDPKENETDLEVYRPVEKTDGDFLGEVAGGRFLTVSGNVYGDAKPIADRTEKVKKLVKRYWPPKDPPPSVGSFTPAAADPDKDRKILIAALDLIDPALLDFDKWSSVVSAMKACGFSVQDAETWSAKGGNPKNVPGYTGKRWEKFRLPNRSDIGAGGVIVNLAKQFGFSVADAFTDEERRQYGIEQHKLSAEKERAIEKGWIIHREEEQEAPDKAPDESQEKQTLPKTPPPLICMSDVEETEVEWLFPEIMPIGAITTLAADGGSGKTFHECELLAAVSTGRKSDLFGQSNNGVPAKAIVFNGEDGLSDVLKKRLRLSRSDDRNIFTASITSEVWSDINFQSKELDYYIRNYQPKLVVFDPIQQFLPENVQMERRNHMRRTLSNLTSVAQKYRCSILLIAHTNKQRGNTGRTRIADSADLWDISRSVLMSGTRNNEGTGSGGFYLSHEKSNYAKCRETYLYSINDSGLHFDGITQEKDRDFINQKLMLNDGRKQGGAPKRDSAVELIDEFLGEQEGCVCEVNELDAYLRSMSVASKTIRNAKSAMKKKKLIRIYDEGFGKGKKWFVKRLTPYDPEGLELDINDLELEDLDE